MCKIYKYVVLLTMPLALSACKDNDDIVPVNLRPDWQPPTDQWVDSAPRWVAYLPHEDSRPDWAVDITGDDPAPDWQAPDNLKYPSSMTAVLVVPDFIKPYESAQDMIAAFVGDECRGIGDIVLVNGVSYYFVNIKGSDTDDGQVTFKYYNSRLHTLYTADNDVRFRLDSVYGTVASPQQAVFSSVGKYPLHMTLQVSIDQNLGGFAAGDGDVLAVFAGNECRAVADISPSASAVSLDVLGREDGETLYVYYYTSQYKGVLMHKDELVFEHEAVKHIVPSFRALDSVDVYLQVSSELRACSDDVAQIGVFVGDECRSYSLSMGQGRFHALVLADMDEEVTVKYYIDAYRMIFESTPVSMQELLASDETHYYTVPLVTEDRYPLSMRLVLGLTPDLSANADAGDMMAAFIGDECRGVAYPQVSDGEMIYVMDVVRQIGESQKVTIKYYSSKTGTICQSMPFIFEHNVTMGTESYPEYMYFNEVEDLHPYLGNRRLCALWTTAELCANLGLRPWQSLR